jgi:uncharacterized protein (TIGR02217 family)
MSFYEVQFPVSISYGASGGPAYSTDVVSFASGFEQRNQEWSVARLKYDVSHGIKNQANYDILLAFFRNMKGKANGFRFKDWADYQTIQTNGVLGAGIGSGAAVHQLGKNYVTAGASTETRVIKKPVSGTAALLRAGAAVTFGSTPGNAAIDITTGLITFVADSTSVASSITAGATTQVILSANPGTLVAGQKLQLSGFTGADAALVNNLAHTINSVTGAGPYTFILATVTTGKIITLGSGLGAKYPQVSETLTWSGEFDVPCRFDTDDMKTSIVVFQGYQWQAIPVVELRI